MVKKSDIYDVFLFHSAVDEGLSTLVCRQMEAGGLRVFTPGSMTAGKRISDKLRQEIVACTAVVVIATPASTQSSFLGYEVGMAAAWNKPVIVLFDGLNADDLPSFLQEYQLFAVKQIDQAIEWVRRAGDAFSDQQRIELATAYRDFGVPTDVMVFDPAAMHEFVRSFNNRSGTAFDSQKIIRELMRLRKTGQLPKVPMPVRAL